MNELCQKCSETNSVCYIVVKSSSRYSLVHLLPASFSKSAPRPPIFFGSYVKSSSPFTVLRAFCRQLYPIEPHNRGNSDHSSHFTQKGTGFRARGVFKPKFMRSWSLTLPKQLFDDDVDAMMMVMMMMMMIDMMMIDMMMWGHDGGKAGHDNLP